MDTSPGWLGDLAFNTQDNVWLVVSGGGNISGRIMSQQGQPVTSVFQVNPSAHSTYTPVVAYASTGNKFLVVWNAYANSGGPVGIYGRFVSGSGTMEAPFHLGIDGSLNRGADKVTRLSFDARNQRFVFVLMDPTRLTTIDLSGNRGKLIDLSTVSGGNWNPKVAINEVANEYCVVYDQRSGGVTGVPAVAMRRVNASDMSLGAETGAPILTTSSDVVYNSLSGKYFAVHGAGAGTTGRLLNSCNINDMVGAAISVSQNMAVARLAYNPKSNVFGVFGTNYFAVDNLYALLGGSTGSVLHMGSILIPPVNGQYLPAISANLDDGTFGVVTDRDYAATYLVVNLGVEVLCSP